MVLSQIVLPLFILLPSAFILAKERRKKREKRTWKTYEDAVVKQVLSEYPELNERLDYPKDEGLVWI
mgnify:CR=1 FL=1